MEQSMNARKKRTGVQSGSSGDGKRRYEGRTEQERESIAERSEDGGAHGNSF